MIKSVPGQNSVHIKLPVFERARWPNTGARSSARTTHHNDDPILLGFAPAWPPLLTGVWVALPLPEGVEGNPTDEPMPSPSRQLYIGDTLT